MSLKYSAIYGLNSELFFYLMLKIKFNPNSLSQYSNQLILLSKFLHKSLTFTNDSRQILRHLVRPPPILQQPAPELRDLQADPAGLRVDPVPVLQRHLQRDLRPRGRGAGVQGQRDPASVHVRVQRPVSAHWGHGAVFHAGGEARGIRFRK